jgi:glycosyltransferase involved in cell wall biosynthesis
VSRVIQSLSVIIPVYNEESLVLQVIEKLQTTAFPTFVGEVEIIVVDDCSSDRTFQNLQLHEFQTSPSVKIFRHEKNLGKGAAVRTGIKASQGDVLLIQDADLELSPNDIPEMLRAMHELNVDFINGSRYLPGVYRPLASYRRYLANKFFTWLTSVIINVRLTDMACGYKLFTRSIYDQIQLRENRFGFEAELIIKAMRIKRNNIAEVPVRYFPRNEGEGKKLRNSDGLKILSTIVKYGLLRLK